MSRSSVDLIFDLEQQILQCWIVTDDIEMLYKHFGDHPRFAGLDPKAEDEMMNLMLGLKSLYALKFETMWKTFEEVAKEYHVRGKRPPTRGEDNDQHDNSMV